METMPWYKSNTLRALIVAAVAWVLQSTGVLAGEAEAGAIADMLLQVIQFAALGWAAYARVRQPTPPITQTAAAGMAEIQLRQEQSLAPEKQHEG